MKIAMVGQFPPHFGGVGVHIHTLSKELVKQGHEVYVITYPHADLADIDGIHVIGTKGINIPGIRGLMFKRNAKKALEKLLKEVDIDIVHGHYLFPAGAAAVVVFVCGLNALVAAPPIIPPDAIFIIPTPMKPFIAPPALFAAP